MRFLLTVLVFLSISTFAQKTKVNNAPKLVIGIVVDQMRPDYLSRFYNKFSEGGFKRIMHDGNVCENTFINYLPSYTGPGHTCIYTGSVPALHGIASNDWIDKLSGKPIYCTADPTVQAVGGTDRAGKMSPRNLWATTITDELRLASNFQSKVIAISLKDRASILPGGHSANAAYWMDDSNSVFMSSSYYMNTLPDWVNTFNQKGLAKSYMNKDWNVLNDIKTYTESTQDNNAYEGKFTGETNTSFPHKTSSFKTIDIKKTPYGNSILFDFANETISKEEMGQGSTTDFLCMSLSSPDYVGHQFGPNSIEIEDTYIRLDLELAAFLNNLDDKIGAGNYTIFLTADHGVAHNPQFLLDHKIAAGFFFGSSLKTELNGMLQNVYHSNTLVRSVGENFIFLNDLSLDSVKAKRQDVINTILKQLTPHEEIQFAVDMQNIQQSVLPTPIKEMAINGYVSRRSGDILLLLNPAWLDAYAKTGTTHGTWNPYDTHIPLIWYGCGIQKGVTRRMTHMTDIAATLATLLHVQMPNACIGEPIVEVVK